MVDEAWIRELEVRAAPLRVELPPWGEVLAREALRAPARDGAPHTRRWIVAGVVALAAAIAVAAWPSRTPTTSEATLVESIEPEPTVAVAPPEVVPLPVVPPPSAAAAPPASAPPPSEETPLEAADAASLAKVPPVRAPAKRRAPRRSAPPAEAPLTVDCILDPKLCRPDEPTAPPAELPETLGSAAVKRALEGIKPQVIDCARAHNAVSKQKVTVKLTIAGATGTVVSANIVQPELSAALEQCILAAVQRAQFPQFRKERMGVMFPLTMP